MQYYIFYWKFLNSSMKRLYYFYIKKSQPQLSILSK